MKAVKKKIKKRSIILRISLLAFAVYVAVTLVSLQIQLSEAKKEKESIDGKIKALSVLNEDAQDKIDNYEKYQEQSGREKGYAYPEDDVIIVAPGT